MSGLAAAFDGTAGDRPSGAAQANGTRGGGQDLPVIGITAAAASVRIAVMDLAATFAPHSFMDRIYAAGGLPVLLPPRAGAETAVPRLDGLLMLAGPDVDPARYGAERHAATRRVEAARDEAESAELAAALAAGVPVLGVCRGLQVMNVLRGGTLHQHLPERVGHTEHDPEDRTYGSVRVRTEPGSRIAAILGAAAEVPCHHHQAVDRLGEGLVATAWAADGTVEAVEAVDHPFAVAVQWHAEESPDDRVFLALTEAARRHRALARGRVAVG